MEKAKTTIEKAKEMNDILHIGSDFVVLDIETTALSPDKGGMIIEIGAVKIQDGKIIDTYSQLINPERKIYPKTTEITGITNEMVAGKPVYGQVLPEFYRFLRNAIVVAHNATFDWDRYFMFFFPKVGIYPTNKVVDTLPLSKLYFPDKSGHKLNEMCEELGVQLTNHHRALDDAMATAEMLLIYKNKYATQLFNPSFAENQHEQVDLFNYALQMEVEESQTPSVDIYADLEQADSNVEEEPKEEQEIQYRVKRVKYWEKIVSNKAVRRLYVTLSVGTAYFDVHTRTWYNKDVKQNINFDALCETVLRFLKLQTIDDLCSFRN
ncbi:exonuclease domain-containing protein (plasmid) [Aneurinibacillus sp. Ricciae_BoGa-3]|uniref:3'-5' exonuclease n=1 Tax=Aneurinibacillus sp. Ricciae_BoGa-3 TaxID=3022697 RepID=UPI0023402B26|nr:exonuclease domain-containing protein [Aneurinibacillus sp. Ricciae_BoGa-3]WCK57614.1 exonuclease domain-containing protein [Aneurinibacillus sp. Ricciae_BoGa-3]